MLYRHAIGSVAKDGVGQSVFMLWRAVAGMLRSSEYGEAMLPRTLVAGTKKKAVAADPQCPADPNPQGNSAVELLTPRERQILPLMASGHTTREIAAALALSEKTVESHRTRILRKFGLRSVVELVAYVMKHRVLPL
jgi:DNA-binding NarL/FixJ family response regulator